MKNCFASHAKVFPKEEMADLLADVRHKVAAGMDQDAANIAAVDSALIEAQSDFAEVVDAIQTQMQGPAAAGAAALELAKVRAADAQASRDEAARERGSKALDSMEAITEKARERMLKADPAVLAAKPTPADWMTAEEKRRYDRLQAEAAAVPALTLTAPTPAELKSKADAEQVAALKAEADAKAAENKAKADAEVGELALTGSDRIADVAAAAGQQDIFGQQTAEAQRENNLDPLPAEAAAVQKGVEGKTLAEVAVHLARNAPDADQRMIAERVAEKIREMEREGVAFSFTVAHVGDKVPVNLVSARGMTKSGKDGMGRMVAVLVNGSDVIGKVGVSWETVLHELVHAVTLGEVREGNKASQADTPLGKDVAALYDVTNAIIRHFNERQKSGAKLTPFEREIFEGRNNAFRDQNETLAWALTNRDAQAYLEGIPYDSKQSFWSKLVQAIREFLGLPASANTALSEVLRIGENLITVREAARVQAAKPMPKVTQMTLFQKRNSDQTETPDITQHFSVGALASSPRVTGMVHALMNSPAKLSPFNAFNTQYHKAVTLARKGLPQFKAVFDKMQAYLNDTNAIAVAAEQKAQSIFREMRGIGFGSIKAYFKGAASETDIATIGPWLNQGTLYGGANPLEGVVWTDDELRGIQTPINQGGRILPRDAVPLTEAQIPLYRQARAAIAQAIHDGAKAVIYRNVAKHGVTFDKTQELDQVVATVLDQLGEKRNALKLQEQYATEQADAAFAASQEAKQRADASPRDRILAMTYDRKQYEYKQAQKALDDIKSQITVLDDLIGTPDKPGRINQIDAHAQALIDHGYMPLKRFGNRTVTARTPTGKVVFFGAYDGKPLIPGSADIEMHEVASELKALHPDWTITTSVRDESSWKMYQGLSLDALENFLEYLDPETKAAIQSDAVIQEYLSKAVNNRSVLKELIHRKGTKGFSTDVPRVLASFITSHARNSSGMYHISEARQLVQDIPQEQGDIRGEAVNLIDYVTKPGEEAAKLRGFLFFHFLGGSVAAAIVNLSQTVMMTAPFLHQYASTKQVAGAITTAGVQAVQDPAGIPGERGRMLQKAEQEGVTAPQQIHHLTATAANNPFSSNRSFRSFMAVWGGMFGAAEVFNRRVAFLAAFDIGTQGGMDTATAYEFAKDAVNQTQGIYNKGNRPNLGRGALGATVMTFKTFSIMYLELLKRLPPQQQLVMLGILMLAAGAEGLPFAEDIEDLVDTLGQWLGYSTNTGKWTGKVVKDTFGKEFERPLLKGLGGMLPLDLHSRLGMQNLLPGTAFFKPSEIDKTRDVAEAVGPIGSVLKAFSDSLQMLARGHWDQAAVGMAPKMVRDAVAGAGMAVTGESKDTKGRLAMKDVTAGEALGKAIGFNPQRASIEGEAKREIMLDRNLRTVRQDDIASDWADAIMRGDKERQKEALARFVQWNKDNPEMRLDGPGMMRSVLERVKASAMTSAARFEKSTPKPMKAEARESLRQ